MGDRLVGLFFQFTPQQWLQSNLELDEERSGLPWCLLFGNIVDLWQRRNDLIFNQKVCEPIEFIFEAVRIAFQIQHGGHLRQKVQGVNSVSSSRHIC